MEEGEKVRGWWEGGGRERETDGQTDRQRENKDSYPETIVSPSGFQAHVNTSD